MLSRRLPTLLLPHTTALPLRSLSSIPQSPFFDSQKLADFEASNWGDHANKYEAHLSSKLEVFAASALEILAQAQPKDSQNLRILDVGCGAGAVLAELAKNSVLYERIKSFNAIDFSAGMVDISTKRHHQSAHKFPLHHQVMDGQNLLFADNSFDHALSMFALIFFPDRVKGLSEIHRVLVPGGSAVVAGWVKADWIVCSNQALKMVVGENAIPTPPKDYVPNFLCWSKEELPLQEMKQAGFGSVQFIPVTKRFSFPSPEPLKQMWLAMRHAFPTLAFAMDHIGKDPKLDEEVANTFVRVVAERSKGDTPFVDGTACVVVGTK